MGREFPGQWLSIIEKKFGLYSKLSQEDKAELLQHILVFLDEKRFEGCGGLKITDEIKVIIAAQACMLLLHRETDYYPRLGSILVYPSAFIAKRVRHVGCGIVSEDEDVLRGESWVGGSVVLSWDDVKNDVGDIHDGENVVFHEFAHQIDSSFGKGDSSEVLRSSSNYIAWARQLGKDYDKLRKAAAQNKPSFLNKYGAVNPAEFFAVATEFFFERPVKLKQIHPQLYESLKKFYHQDPVNFFREDL
jgi:hypothetical protein